MTAFARITEEHDAALSDLTPCAGRLYRWLLRRAPAGRPMETYLEDFAAWSGYSLRHVQRSLQQLLSTSLVEVVTRYSARIYKLVTWHPNQDKNVPTVDQKDQKWMEMSKRGGSKPHSAVPKQQRFLETTDNSHPHHPVENEQESKVDPRSGCQPLTGLQEQKLILAQQAIAPHRLSPQLEATVLKYSCERIIAAAEALQEQQQKRKVKNPSGLFRRALENGWKPNKSGKPSAAEAPRPAAEWEHVIPPAVMAEFNEWFPLAREVGIALGSERIQGELYIHTRDGCEPFSYLTSVWPLHRLLEMPKRF